uniref:Uncharacterized protein n=1 Tax=Pyrodinium bahamense TaxID=73915 RepID=A0A7S0B9U7_9DINO
MAAVVPEEIAARYDASRASTPSLTRSMSGLVRMRSQTASGRIMLCKHCVVFPLVIANLICGIMVLQHFGADGALHYKDFASDSCYMHILPEEGTTLRMKNGTTEVVMKQCVARIEKESDRAYAVSVRKTYETVWERVMIPHDCGDAEGRLNLLSSSNGITVSGLSVASYAFLRVSYLVFELAYKDDFDALAGIGCKCCGRILPHWRYLFEAIARYVVFTLQSAKGAEPWMSVKYSQDCPNIAATRGNPSGVVAASIGCIMSAPVAMALAIMKVRGTGERCRQWTWRVLVGAAVVTWLIAVAYTTPVGLTVDFSVVFDLSWPEVDYAAASWSFSLTAFVIWAVETLSTTVAMLSACCVYDKDYIDFTKQVLDLSHNALSDDDMHKFRKGLAANLVETLHLRNNTIGNSGADRLFEAVTTNNSLKHLNLSCNTISQVDRLFETLVANHTLTHLDLSFNMISEADRPFEALAANSNLTILNLGDNQIREADPLFGALASNSGLRTLILESNKISQVDMLGDTLAASTSLTSLDLRYNQLSQVDRLGAALAKNCTLQELWLWGNKIVQADALFGALAENTSLMRLSVASNRISQVGQLGHALSVNRTLEELQLQRNQISEVEWLLGALAKNETLKNVDLSRNKLSEESRACVTESWGERGGHMAL